MPGVSNQALESHQVHVVTKFFMWDALWGHDDERQEPCLKPIKMSPLHNLLREETN